MYNRALLTSHIDDDVSAPPKPNHLITLLWWGSMGNKLGHSALSDGTWATEWEETWECCLAAWLQTLQTLAPNNVTRTTFLSRIIWFYFCSGRKRKYLIHLYRLYVSVWCFFIRGMLQKFDNTSINGYWQMIFFACLAVIVAGSANGSGRHLRTDWMCVSLLLLLQGFNLPLLLILLSVQHTAFSTPCRGNRNRRKEAWC